MAYLTPKQRQVLDFIRQMIKADGVAPTLREISEHFGFSSTASAQKHVNLLAKKGFLVRDKHQKRGLVLAGERKNPEGAVLSMVGSVAAGSPIENFSEHEPVIVPPEMIGPGEHFVLEVRGLSMIGDGIHEGDRIVVRRTPNARPGETVVATIDGEATLKRFFPQPDGTIRLESSNPDMPSFSVAAERLVIEGVLVGLLRRY